MTPYCFFPMRRFRSPEVLPELWSKDRNLFLFEHNNISNVFGSWTKPFFYRRIPTNAVGLTFQDHVVWYRRERCAGRRFAFLFLISATILAYALSSRVSFDE